MDTQSLLILSVGIWLPADFCVFVLENEFTRVPSCPATHGNMQSTQALTIPWCRRTVGDYVLYSAWSSFLLGLLRYSVQNLPMTPVTQPSVKGSSTSCVASTLAQRPQNPRNVSWWRAKAMHKNPTQNNILERFISSP
ncbi:unnamed protein product [Ectocarpus fasciculatus]